MKSSPNYELYFSGCLAVFAACLALNELGAGKYGEDEIRLGNEKSAAYQWYQSKSIKESLAEGQKEFLSALLLSDAVRPESRRALASLSARAEEEIRRYKKEKKEILLGSKAVGQENWAQDVDGKMGAVVGAKEHELTLDRLGRAGDRFDFATLFLQLSLVMGAIGLLTREPRFKALFLSVLVVLGLTGCGYSIAAYLTAAA